MAQGSGKLGKAGGRKKSGGSQRRKTVKVAKKQNKGSSKVERKDKAIVAATKQINRKNERIIAAKATNAHTKFYLKDLTQKGTVERNGFLLCIPSFVSRCFVSLYSCFGLTSLIPLSLVRFGAFL